MSIPTLSLKEAYERFEQKTLCGAFKMSNRDYHAAPGISKTTLDNIEESPLYFRYSREMPLELKEPLIFGSVYHCLWLEDEPFEELFYITETQPKSPKIDAHGRWPISEANLAKIKLMLGQLARHKRAPSLKMGLREVSFFWTDPDTGILCKCKPDTLLLTGIVNDNKTTTNVKPEAFSRTISERRYHVQGAFILDGVRQALAQSGQDIGLERAPDTFVLTAQEKSAPFDILCSPVGPASLGQGEELYKKNLETYARCVRDDFWPGKDGGRDMEEIDCPLYTFK
jgi:hypothetical protein